MGRPPYGTDRDLLRDEGVVVGDSVFFDAIYRPSSQGLDRRAGFWLVTTPAVMIATEYHYQGSQSWFGIFEMETERRALKFVLAVQLWRLEHGGACRIRWIK